MSQSDQEIEEVRRILIERSPVITVSYNRKNADKVGSLSTELLKKLNDKHHFDDDEGVNSQGSRRSRKNFFTNKISQEEQTRVETQTSRKVNITGQETLRDLLEQEPLKNRFKSMMGNQLEFMSYLRPILKDTHFDDDDGEGWGFLSTHVQQNPYMFKDILKERRRQAAIISDRKEYNRRIAQKQQEIKKKEIQARKERIEKEEADRISKKLSQDAEKIKRRVSKLASTENQGSSRSLLKQEKKSQKSLEEQSLKEDSRDLSKSKEGEMSINMKRIVAGQFQRLYDQQSNNESGIKVLALGSSPAASGTDWKLENKILEEKTHF